MLSTLSNQFHAVEWPTLRRTVGHVIKRLVLTSTLLLVASCAQMVRDSADEKLKSGQFEAAIQELQAGLKDYPDSTLLRTAQVSMSNEVQRRLIEQITQQRAYGQYEDAKKTLVRALSIEPQSTRLLSLQTEIAADQRNAKALQEAGDLAASGQKIQALKRLESALRESPRQPALLALQRRLEADVRSETPELGQRSLTETRPISLDFRNAPLGGVLEALTKGSGINFVLDRDVKQDARISVFLRQAKLEDALDLVLGAAALTRRIVDANTVLIYPNTLEKQREHQELVVRVFHLANAEAKTTANLLKTMLKVREPFVDERANLVAIRESADVINMAERLVALHDVGDAEVMLDVEILEVSAARLTDLGINYPNGLTLTPLSASGTSTGLTISQLRSLTSDNVGVSISPLQINLRREVSDAQVLANPRIRAKNREKAHVLIGDKVPVVTTTSSATGIVGESVNYLEVGLKLDVEPLISPEEEVTIKLALEVSTITQQIKTASGGTAYQIGTRNASTTLRLRDGETQMLGGLISRSDKSSAARVPGLGDLPVLGRLFSAQLDNKNQSELVLAITPRILKAAAKPDWIKAQLWVGTEQHPRLKASPYLAAVAASKTNEQSSRDSEVVMPDLQSATRINSNNLPAAKANSMRSAMPSAPPKLSWQSSENLEVGKESTVHLLIDSVQGLRGAPLEIGFSSDFVEILQVIEGDFFRQDGKTSSFTNAINRPEGKLSLGLLRSDGSSAKGQGGLISLRLRPLKKGLTKLSINQFTPLGLPLGTPPIDRPYLELNVQ
jgi:general secretion pathway protein D